MWRRAAGNQNTEGQDFDVRLGNRNAGRRCDPARYGDEIMHACEAARQTAGERLLTAQREARGARPGVETAEPHRWSPEPIASGMSLRRSRGGLEVVSRGCGPARGESRLLEHDPPETPAAPAPVRDGSVPRAHLLWLAAALLLEVIADDAPDDLDGSALALERGLRLAEPDRVLFPALVYATLGLLERHAGNGPAGAARASRVASLLGEAGGPARPPGEPAWPGEPLTQSETRVLRYLPTHLGAQEIAAELYLSANTIKTHLRHLYQKLGAHSRLEAVQRARPRPARCEHESLYQRPDPEYMNGGKDHVIRARRTKPRPAAPARSRDRQLLAGLDEPDPEQSTWLQEVTSRGK
jgi:DNA-binding CsgD family transcriptional regulator